MVKLALAKAIPLSKEATQKLFWDIASWQAIWDPIHRIEVLYEDGHHQEFTMNLEWKGAVHQIRTVRFQEASCIEFFSPMPPPPMIRHKGKWIFSSLSNHECLVEAIREYETNGVEEGPFHAEFQKRLSKLLDQFAAKV